MQNIISDYLTRVKETIDKIDTNTVNEVEKIILSCVSRKGFIYIFGNGGSGATASHIAGDYLKGASYKQDKKFRTICLNDNIPGLMAIANDISYDDIFSEPLKNYLTKDDIVIGISGSGNSKNILKAIDYSNEIGATTIGLCGFNGGELKKISNICIHAEINDMEISEDIHIMIFHAIKQSIIKKSKN